MFGSKARAWLASFAVALAGCATVNEFRATENEQLLRTAGFTIKAGDTPERIEALKSLAPVKISRVGRGGSIFYVFSDPYSCRCLWVGNEEQYMRYRRLEAEALVPEIELVGVDAEPEWALNMEPW